MKLLYGTDPEAFAGYQKDGKLFCLPPYFFRKYLGVAASSDEKHPIFLEGNQYKFHEDGAAFEMSIWPSHDPRELFDRIQECATLAREKILSLFPDHCLPELQFVPTINFDINRWRGEGQDFFMSTRFGCDPDRDAFEMEKRADVVDASEWPFRYGGGHIHFSGSPFIFDDPSLCVKTLAITAGIAAVAFSDVPDLENLRTYLYGRPGKFRVQRYGSNNPFGKDYSVGVEYRTISDRWASNWNIAKEIFNWAEIAFNNLLPSGKAAGLVEELSPVAVDTIISANQEEAKNILSYLGTVV